MSGYKFGVGEYTTRDGSRAIVHFKLREPCRSSFVLMGEVCDKGSWCSGSWTLNGMYQYEINGNARDLMCPRAVDETDCVNIDPVTVTVRRQPKAEQQTEQQKISAILMKLFDAPDMPTWARHTAALVLDWPSEGGDE
jgi:hypothetical protein